MLLIHNPLHNGVAAGLRDRIFTKDLGPGFFLAPPQKSRSATAYIWQAIMTETIFDRWSKTVAVMLACQVQAVAGPARGAAGELVSWPRVDKPRSANSRALAAFSAYLNGNYGIPIDIRVGGDIWVDRRQRA